MKAKNVKFKFKSGNFDESSIILELESSKSYNLILNPILLPIYLFKKKFNLFKKDTIEDREIEFLESGINLDGNYSKSYVKYENIIKYIYTDNMLLFVFRHSGGITRWLDISLDSLPSEEIKKEIFKILKQKLFGVKLSFTPLIKKEITPPLDKFVLMKAGTFIMGSEDNAKSLKEVTIKKDFYMSKYPIKIKEYYPFSKDRGFWTALKISVYTGGDDNKSFFQDMDNSEFVDKNSDRIATNIDWLDAKSYCKWASEKIGIKHRLPSEAEWEYSCRAGTDSKYFWGDDSSNIEYISGYLRDNSFEFKQGKPNPWGLYDMVGYISQWCEEPYLLRGGNLDNYGIESCSSSFRARDREGSIIYGFRVVIPT